MNLLRIAIAFVTALLAFDLVSVRWRCAECGYKFLAMSDSP